MGSIYANKPNTWKSAHSFDHAGYQAIFDAYGTVIFDASGRISGGGAAADSLFGAGQGRIIGRLISAFIPDIRCDADWHGKPTKLLVTLCESVGWQQFEALDIFGRGKNYRL